MNTFSNNANQQLQPNHPDTFFNSNRDMIGLSEYRNKIKNKSFLHLAEVTNGGYASKTHLSMKVLICIKYVSF